MNNDLISRSELCLDLVEKVWPGCDICRGDTKIKSDNFCGAATMRIVGDSIDLRGDAKKIKFFGRIYAPSFSIKFCPFCGRPLTDEAVKMVMGDWRHWIETAPTAKVTGDTSDGYHTFNELYHHRAVLFSVICNDRPGLAWKSKKHHDGTMYDGMFIVGIETPEGQATYHYDIEPYWDMFHVKEVDSAPEWDGHTPDEAIRRIGTLAMVKDAEPVRHGEWILNPGDLYNDATWVCSVCGHEWVLIDGTPQENDMHYCPKCGARMDGGIRHESDHRNSL